METNTLNLKNTAKGILLSMVISIILSAVLATFVYFLTLPDRTVSALIFSLSAISVFFGSLILAKNVNCRGLLHGLLLAVGYLAVLSLISLSVNGSICLNMSNILRFAATVLSGMLGGILGINTK